LCHDRNTNRMLRRRLGFRGPSGAASIKSVRRCGGAGAGGRALQLCRRRLRYEPSLVCQTARSLRTQDRLLLFRTPVNQTAAAPHHRERSCRCRWDLSAAGGAATGSRAGQPGRTPGAFSGYAVVARRGRRTRHERVRCGLPRRPAHPSRTWQESERRSHRGLDLSGRSATGHLSLRTRFAHADGSRCRASASAAAGKEEVGEVAKKERSDIARRFESAVSAVLIARSARSSRGTRPGLWRGRGRHLRVSSLLLINSSD